jgi:hypothetical protein
MTPPDDDEMLAALNENLYDLEEIFPDYDTLETNVYLVKSDDGKFGAVVVDDNGHYRSLTPKWVDINKIGTIKDRRYTHCVTDGKAIYSLYEPYEKKGEVPDGLTITDELATDGSDLLVFVKRDDRIVNIFDCYNGELLLDPANDIEFNDSQFVYAEWDKRNQRYLDEASTDFGPKNYWILTYSAPKATLRSETRFVPREIQTVPDKVYVVNKKGENLADCPCVEVPVDYNLDCVSRDGRYCAYSRCRWSSNSHYPDYDVYLMANGKVYPDTFTCIEPGADDSIWTLYKSSNSSDPYYELDTNTGEIEEKYD